MERLASYVTYENFYEAFLDKKTEMVDKYILEGKRKYLLQGALSRGHCSFFKYILEHHADVYRRNPLVGCSGLEVVINFRGYREFSLSHDHLDLFNLLRLKDAFGQLKFSSGTLLHSAVIYGCVEIVEYLLETSIDVNYRIRCDKNIKDVSDLLETKVQLPIDSIVKCYGDGYYPPFTALEMAIIMNNHSCPQKGELIEVLLENDATLDDETEQLHALHLAVNENANLLIIEKLIEYGANINSVCKKGWTPLSHALEKAKDINVILYLLKRRAIFNKNTINSVFTKFIFNRDIFCEQLFAFIIESGADLNSRDSVGHTPLQIVILKHPGFFTEYEIKLFIDYGSDVNVQDMDRNTPLHLSIKRENEENVKILLEYEADHFLSNSQGKTPLMSLKHVTISEFYASFFLRKCSHFEKMVCYIVRAIVISVECRKYVNPDDLNHVKTKLQCVYDRFKNELEKTKLKKVRGNISYYDILTKSVSVLVKWLNMNVIENIEFSNIEKEFPFYSDMLRMRIRKIKERKILVEFCAENFKIHFYSQYFKPPFLVTQKIFSYLNSVDLITLWRVFKRKEEYLSNLLNRPGSSCPKGIKFLELYKHGEKGRVRPTRRI